MASLRVELSAASCDALEFAQPANSRWGEHLLLCPSWRSSMQRFAAKSQICVSFMSSPVKHIQVGDFVAGINGRSLTKMSYEEALSIIRASKGVLVLKIIRPSEGASQMLVAKRGQLMRRLLSLAKQIQAIHAQYQQTIQANATVHSARGDLHTRLEQLRQRFSALNHRKAQGYNEQFELVRVRAALRAVQNDKKNLAHAFVEQRKANESAEEQASAALQQATGSEFMFLMQNASFGGEGRLPNLVQSILQIAPQLLQVHAFCSTAVQRQSPSFEGGRATSTDATPTSPTAAADGHSAFSAPAQLPSSNQAALQCTDFERDLMGEHRFDSLLGHSQLPATQAGQALQEATSALRELRDMLSTGVAPRLSAAWKTLVSLRRQTPALAGVPLMTGQQLHTAPPGSTADHTWLEPAGEAEDVRMLRLACGAVGLQLQLLTALHTKACQLLQISPAGVAAATAEATAEASPAQADASQPVLDKDESSSLMSGFSTAESAPTL